MQDYLEDMLPAPEDSSFEDLNMDATEMDYNEEDDLDECGSF